MRPWREFLTGLALALAAGNLLAAGEPRMVELDTFLGEAWQADPRTAAQRAEVQAAGQLSRQAAAQRLPSVWAELTGGWTSETQELRLPTRTVEFGDGTSVDAALRAGWTAYAGGALRAAERRAGHDALARGEEAAADSLARLADLREAFYATLGAEAVHEAARLAVERLERARADLAARQAAGTLLPDALLLAEARLEGACAELALRAGEWRVARLQLAAMAGHPDEEWQAAGDLERPLDGVEEGARRPAHLLALDARVRAGREAEAQAQSWRRPRVETGLAWHWARPGVDPVANEWMGYAGATVRVAWSVWDNRLGRLREGESRLRRRALEERLRDAGREADARLTQVREQLAAALEAEERVARRTDLESRRLELVEARWRAGMATEREWLDTQDDLRLAQWERALAAARVRRVEIRLLQAKGR